MNPFHSPSSSSSSFTFPKKKGFKGNSPPRLDPFIPGANTPNLKACMIKPLICSFCLGQFRKLSKDGHKPRVSLSKDPHHQEVNCCTRCGMWFKMKHGKTTCDAKGLRTWKSTTLKCLSSGLGRLWPPPLPP